MRFWGILAGVWLISASAAIADSRKPIRIALLDDPQQQVTANLAAAGLKQSGYQVAFVEIDRAGLIEAISTGEVHVQPEWPAGDPELQALLDDGKVVDMGRRNNEDGTPEIRKIIWKGMKKPWPGAVKLFRNFSYPSSEQAKLVTAIAGGDSMEDVIEQWLVQHRDRLQKWKSVTKNWMKP